MKDYLLRCCTCPRKCKVNRHNSVGFCKAKDKVKVAHISLHKFEEPCISFEKGSGTVFFSGCNLKCVFCQNYMISGNEYGVELTIEGLSNIFLKLQNMGAENINLVSPTIYALQIRDALLIAKKNGLNIPVIYNTNGYENVQILEKMQDVVDIYLPDFKYYYDALGEKYSNVKNYRENAFNTLKECLRQKCKNVYSEEGKLLSGVIIRHLVLPNHILNTKNTLKFLKENFGENITLSVMMQYFPTNKANDFDKINRKVSRREYEKVLGFLDEFNLKNGYVQNIPEDEEKYVPNFDISTLN